MTLVTLVSGGVDSTLMAALAAEATVMQYPLFINYGQRAAERELAACRYNLSRLGLSEPLVADIRGYGLVARSGLTDPSLDVFMDAFTPGRNLLFLTVGAAYATTVGAGGVAIGLLTEDAALFPDQTSAFLATAEQTISVAMGRPLKVLAPLLQFTKADVLAAAKRRSIDETYSCHAGHERPCGVCVACREFNI